MNRSFRKGFTLVELLIVIAIIAILSAIGLIAYSNFIKNARNSRRQADLKLVQTALEDYHSDQLFYPGNSFSFASAFSLTNSTGNPNTVSNSKTYLNNVPIGPLTSSEYLYKPYKWNSQGTAFVDCVDSDNLSTSTSKCIKYCLYAQAENFTLMNDLCPDQSGYTLEVISP